MAQEIAARLRMSNRFALYLGTLIRQHLRLGFLIREHPLTRRALARYRRDVSPWVFESVVVSLCDRLATRGEKTPAVSMARHYRVARSVWTAVSKAPVPQVLSGDDVMEVLGIEPGPAVGQALDALEEEVESGEVRTEDEARDFLLRLVAARERGAGGGDGTAGSGRRRRRRGSARCLSCPRSRPYAAACSRACRASWCATSCVNDATVSEQSEAELRALLAGRRVTGLRRRGKYLIVDLDGAAGPSVAVIHLRMTGQLLFRPEPGERPPRFVWRLEPDTDLQFQDVRRFGRLWAFPPEAEAAFFAAMGPGAVLGGLHASRTCATPRAGGRRRSSRSCSTSGASPASATSTPTRRSSGRACTRCGRPGRSGRVRRSACTRPSSRPCRTASTTRARPSRASSTLPAAAAASRSMLRVYQRTGQPCRVCGATIRRLEVGGRGTHYCPSCQPRRGGMSRGSRRLRGSAEPPRSGKPADWEPPDR